MLLGTTRETRRASTGLDIFDGTVLEGFISYERVAGMVLHPLDECIRVVSDWRGRRVPHVFEDSVKDCAGRLRQISVKLFNIAVHIGEE
jgi:hypothetical protein